MADNLRITETPAQQRTLAVADELLKDLVELLSDKGLVTRNTARMRRLREALIEQRYWIIDIVEHYRKENPVGNDTDTN